MAIRIRPASASDEPELSQLATATWSADVSPGPERPDDVPFFEGWRTPENVLVATEGDRVVGYVLFANEIPVPSHQHVVALQGLAVAPGSQRQGIGRSLVQAAIDHVTQAGVTRVTSRVLSTNPASLALHESLGFVREGALVGEFLIDGNSVDDVLLAVRVGGAVAR